MAYRLYLVPALGTPPYPMSDPRRPKYIFDLQPPGSWRDYGYQPVFLCGVDLTPAQDAAVVANSDVFAFPFNLDGTISGGAVNTRKAVLENFFIPGDGVVNGMTERQCGRYIGGLFLYMQTLRQMLGPEVFIDTTEKLNFQWSVVPVDPYQNAILAAAQALGHNTSFIQSNTQVRHILRNFADQWGDRAIRFDGNFAI